MGTSTVIIATKAVGGSAYSGICTKPSALVADLAFESNQCREEKRNTEFKELIDILSRRFGDSHEAILMATGFITFERPSLSEDSHTR
jgi:hypothetical protein